MLTASPLSFWFSYYPGVGKEPGGMDEGVESPLLLIQSEKRNAPQKLLSQLL